MILWLDYVCVEPQRTPYSAAYFFIYTVKYGSLLFRLLFVTNGLTSSAQVHEFYCLHVVVYLSLMLLSARALYSNMTVHDARI